MFINYSKIAFRNIKRHKGYAFINIFGLAVGMAVFTIIMLWVYDKFSYDKYHENRDRIYLLGVDFEAGSHMRFPMSMPPIAPLLVQQFPEIKNIVRLARPHPVSVKHKDQLFQEDLVCFADNSLFDIFTFPFISGNPETALTAPYSVVLTETTAQKYFGDEDAIGKMLKIDGDTDYAITGVIKDVPRNSHFRFNMVRSFETLYAQNRQAM